MASEVSSVSLSSIVKDSSSMSLEAWSEEGNTSSMETLLSLSTDGEVYSGHQRARSANAATANVSNQLTW